MSGLTRSSSQQGSAPSSRPGSAGGGGGAASARYASPGVASSLSAKMHQHAHTSASRYHHHHQYQAGGAGGGGAGGGHQSPQHHLHFQYHPPVSQLPQQEYVTMEEFLQLKRQLDRERGQREEAVAKLREELYQMKESRRRDKLDSTVALAHGVGGGIAGAGGGAASSSSAAASVLSGGGGGVGDHSILARLHRVEQYHAAQLPRELEAVEERMRLRVGEAIKSVSDATKAEFKRVAERAEQLGANNATQLKAEIAPRVAALDNTVAQLAERTGRTASAIEVLQTHRSHDDDTRQRIEAELNTHHEFVKRMDAQLPERIREELTRRAAADEGFVTAELERRMTSERDQVRDVIQARYATLESQVLENYAALQAELNALRQIATRQESDAERIALLESSVAQVETAAAGRMSDALRQHDGRTEELLQKHSVATHALLKELNARLETQITDKVDSSRDELETDVAQQLQDVSERIDELAQVSAASMTQQQHYVRSLAMNLEHGSGAAQIIVDGLEAFVRDMNPEQAAPYRSCLERIAQCRSAAAAAATSSSAAAGSADGSSSTMMGGADASLLPSAPEAMKLLYQFGRSQAQSVNALRDDIADIRMQIGLVGAANAAGPGARGGK